MAETMATKGKTATPEVEAKAMTEAERIERLEISVTAMGNQNRKLRTKLDRLTGHMVTLVDALIEARVVPGARQRAALSDLRESCRAD